MSTFYCVAWKLLLIGNAEARRLIRGDVFLGNGFRVLSIRPSKFILTWVQGSQKSLCLGYVKFALISEPGTSQVVVLLLWLSILEAALGKRIVIQMKSLFQCFFFQFCDVGTLVMIHKEIQPNLAIDWL